MSRHARPLPRKRTRSELRREKVGAYLALVLEAFRSDRFIEIGILATLFLMGAGAAFFAYKTGW